MWKGPAPLLNAWLLSSVLIFGVSAKNLSSVEYVLSFYPQRAELQRDLLQNDSSYSICKSESQVKP